MFLTNLEIFGIFIIFIVLKDSLFLDEEYITIFKSSDINFWIIMLVLIIFFIMVIVDFYYKMRLNILLIILFYIIIVNRLLVFFLFYEIVYILIIFVIVLLGYSYERLRAAFLMIFYSFWFSSPVLMMLLIFDHTFLIKEWLFHSVIINIFFVGSFMVKFPIFGFHYWLPVAHVEASTIGSILLAGVLLKLGSIGILYVISYIHFIIKFHWLVLAVPIVILFILNLRDLKIIIAYSSIAHMRIVFYVMILGWRIGKKGRIYIIFYHGFISPLIFWVVGLLTWWKTRSLIVVKIISFSTIFLFMLFFLCILNIGFPPFIGFLREVIILKAATLRFFIQCVLITSVLFSCYYNIYIYWCFNRAIGIVFKNNLFNIDLFLFLLLRVFLNFF